MTDFGLNPNLTRGMAEAGEKARLKQSTYLMAYDLALRVKGVHATPQLTEEQAVEVYRYAVALAQRLCPD